MRAIEKAMLAAVRAGKSRRLGNTEVAFDSVGGWTVTLHGNLIAKRAPNGMVFTLAGWGTPTTRSRVNALLRAFVPGRHAHVYQHEHVQYFGYWAENKRVSRAISTTEWIDPYEFVVNLRND